jgi:hypothetical protein
MNVKLITSNDKKPVINEKVNEFDSRNDANIVKSIINGKLEVGIIHLNQKLSAKLEKYNIHVIPLRMTSQNTMVAIIYRNDATKAHELFNTIKRQMRDSNIHEQNLETFAKEIEKDNKERKLDKEKLYSEDDFTVYVVNGDFVRDKDPGLNFDAFVDGGSHYVTSYPEYKKYIPEDEIWIDDVFRSKPHDLCAIILHEKIERHLMKFYGVSYDEAHSDYAELAETEFREKGQGGFDHVLQTEIYEKYLEKYKKKHPKKKLNEDFQFNKTKELFKKVI